MSQPVKVSDALLLDARLMGEATQRSIAGQIEFWARLRRALEGLLRGDQVLALSKAGKAKPLSACLESVESPEVRQRLATHLKSLPFPIMNLLKADWWSELMPVGNGLRAVS